MRRTCTCVVMLLGIAGIASAQNTLRLTLAEAERLAIGNNPQLSAAQFSAAAAFQVPLELRSNFEPTLSGALTGVGADSGSRLAAGGLNNPVIYNRVGTGLLLSQLVTDFPQIAELDINPFIVGKMGEDSFAADARIQLGGLPKSDALPPEQPLKPGGAL